MPSQPPAASAPAATDRPARLAQRSDSDELTLRAHHLLCILTYKGEGYSTAFVAEFNRTIARLNAGETVRLVIGPDIICAPLCASEDQPHCLDAGPAQRDAQAAADLAPLLGQTLTPDVQLALSIPVIQRLRTAFAQGQIRSACTGCPWHALCTQVAKNGFTQALLVGSCRSGAPRPTPPRHHRSA